MKKSSTAALVLALALAFGVTHDAAAAPSRCAFLASAPDQHVVVRGDTLWGISGKFLEHPWCWPQVWGLNRDQIRDPHWIYPGQIVYFDRAAGRLRLGKPTDSSASAMRISPRVRTEALGSDAIQTIPAGDVEPFLTQALIVEADELAATPRIVATQEGRVYLGKNEKAYVRGNLGDDTSFQVFRPGKPLYDPVSKKVIGYEAGYLGTVKLQRPAADAGEAHTFTVVTAKEEIGVGDRLLPAPPTPIINYAPHLPPQPVDARVVSIYGGVRHAGQNQVIAINRGKNDGIDVGTVLQMYRFGQVIADPTDNKRPVKLPDEQYGTVFVFRVFNSISYGLIMQVTDSAQVGDVVRSPE